jgi:hypothetical protein
MRFVYVGCGIVVVLGLYAAYRLLAGEVQVTPLEQEARAYTGREEMVECPGGCGLRLPESDGWAQKAHMEAKHPEIIAERLRAAGL